MSTTTPPKKNTPVTGKDRKEMGRELKRMYEKGASIRALADTQGRSYGFVHRLLTESGVTLRHRGGATRTGMTSNTDQR